MEGPPETLALAQYDGPAEPRLESIQNQEFEDFPIVMDGNAPLLVVVGDHQGIVEFPAAALERRGSAPARTHEYGGRREARSVRFGGRSDGRVFDGRGLGFAFGSGFFPFQAFFPFFFPLLLAGQFAASLGAFIGSVVLVHGSSFLPRRN
jgi:hypothetical protein